jgi:hypothetical protein
MIKRLAFALAAIVCLATQAEAATPQSYFTSGNTVTLYVRSSGASEDYDGLAATASSSTRGPYPSIASALNQIPNGYRATVIIDLDAATYAVPDMVFVPVPASAKVSGVHTLGSVQIRGACTSVKTWTTSVSWSAVSNKASQVTGNIGAYSGSVTDGSHFIRIADTTTGAEPYTYKIAAGSSSPNLVTVDFATTAYAGTLCAYGTTLSGSPTFTASIGPEGDTHLSFTAVTFSGSPVLRGVRLKGSKLGTPPATLTDVQIQASSLGGAAKIVGRTGNVADIQLSYLGGCIKLLGHFRRVSGVVDGTCLAANPNQKGQLQVGSVGLTFDGGVSDAPDEFSIVDAIESLDVEGNGTCLALESARVRLGAGAASDDMTCRPSSEGGVFNVRAGSRFGLFDARSRITGVVFGKSIVREGSTVGPLHGQFLLQDAGMLVGSRDGGATLYYPGATDADEFVRTFQHGAP